MGGAGGREQDEGQGVTSYGQWAAPPTQGLGPAPKLVNCRSWDTALLRTPCGALWAQGAAGYGALCCRLF